MEEVDPNAEATAGDVAGAVLAAAKKTIISQVVKKNVIENIIPIVIALKVSKLLQKSTFSEEVTVNKYFNLSNIFQQIYKLWSSRPLTMQKKLPLNFSIVWRNLNHPCWTTF